MVVSSATSPEREVGSTKVVDSWTRPRPVRLGPNLSDDFRMRVSFQRDPERSHGINRLTSGSSSQVKVVLTPHFRQSTGVVS
jgi:hypothetical protein